MIRITLLAVLLCSAAGCRNNFDGPREARQKPRADLPEYSISEQQRRARDKHPLFDDDQRIGPSIGNSGPIGR